MEQPVKWTDDQIKAWLEIEQTLGTPDDPVYRWAFVMTQEVLDLREALRNIVSLAQQAENSTMPRETYTGTPPFAHARRMAKIARDALGE